MPNIHKLVQQGITELKCKKCKRILPLSKFRIMKDYVNYCNDCERIKLNKWRKSNPDKTREQKRRHTKRNSEHVKEILKLWKENHPDSVKEHARRAYNKNKEKHNQYFYERLKKEPIFRIQTQMRTDLNKKLKKMFGSCSNRPHKLIGCSLPDLKHHIESQFKDGMSWENYGGKRCNPDGTKRICWEIDHKINMASATTKEEMYKLCHYTNLQPLWWWENIEKSKNEKRP